MELHASSSKRVTLSEGGETPKDEDLSPKCASPPTKGERSPPKAVQLSQDSFDLQDPGEETPSSTTSRKTRSSQVRLKFGRASLAALRQNSFSSTACGEDATRESGMIQAKDVPMSFRKAASGVRQSLFVNVVLARQTSQAFADSLERGSFLQGQSEEVSAISEAYQDSCPGSPLDAATYHEMSPPESPLVDDDKRKEDDDQFYNSIDDEDVGIGNFLDFMHRMWVKMPDSHFARCLSSCIKCMSHSDNSRCSDVPSVKDLRGRNPVFDAIIGMACDERLASFLWEDVLACSNTGTSTESAGASRRALMRIGREVIAYKRQISALRIEAKNYLQRFHLILGARTMQSQTDEAETLEEKHNRLQSFWAQFHASARKFEQRTEEFEEEERDGLTPCQAGLHLKRSGTISLTKKRPNAWKTRPAANLNLSYDGYEAFDSCPPSPVRGGSIMQRAQTLSALPGPEAWAEPSQNPEPSPSQTRRCQSAPSSDQLPLKPLVQKPEKRSSISRPGSSGGGRILAVNGRKKNAFQEALQGAETKAKNPSSVVFGSHRAKQTAGWVDNVIPLLCPSQLRGAKSNSLPNLLGVSPSNRQRSPFAIVTPDMAHEALGTPRYSVQRPESGVSTRRRTSPFNFEDSKFSFDDTGNPDALKADGMFTAPWHSGGGKSVWYAKTCAGKYLRSCGDQGAIPKPLPFMTGNSMKLLAKDVGLTDADLKAVSSMLLGLEVSEIDIEGNAALSDRRIASFLSQLQEEHAAIATLHRLSLKRCMQASSSTMDTVLNMLSHPVSNMHHLDLSGITLGTKYHDSFCRCIQAHPYLRVLHMVQTGLNSMCVSHIFRSKSLDEVDLSWNCFNSDVFATMGECIVENQQIQHLALSNTATTMGQEDGFNITPIVFLLENLSRDRSLRSLDISMNRLDFRGLLVIEDAFACHRRLSQLNVSRNPLGVPGMRSLLRLLSRDSSGLEHLFCTNCSTCIVGNSRETALNLANPGGRYSLNLAAPHHRAVLRMLYKTCDRFGAQPGDAFVDVRYSLPPYAHPAKDADGLWPVARRGRLRTTFNMEPLMEPAFRDIGDLEFGRMLQRYFELTRMKPGFRKVIPLCAHWKTLEGCPDEKAVFLSAISKDFLLTYPQLSEISTSHINKDDERSTICLVHKALLSSLLGGHGARFLAMLDHPSLADYVKTMRNAHSLLNLNIENPTGHYSLDLANSCDYAVAQRLVVLDSWETRINRKLGHFDTSQRGNASQIRNEKHIGHAIDCSNMGEWYMPDRGALEFDYVSTARPSLDAMELDRVSFLNMLLVLNQSESSKTGQVDALRQVAHMFHLRSKQLREMLGIFQYVEVRMEAFVVLFLRITDIWNEKVFRVRFEDPQEVLSLQRRLGNATFFPFIQPEQVLFEFDLSLHDQRLAAHLIVVLGSKEGHRNIREYSYTHQDGQVDPMLLGVPKSWEIFTRMPAEGIFRGHYSCAPEARNFKLRKSMLEQYGYWSVTISETEVMWWAGLTEAPEDVISYLEFLIPRYPHVDLAYDVISEGRGEMNLRAFEDGMKKMKCKKFHGPNELERIKSIFRYLDPGGEGEVSRGEWGVLDMLWKEISLSIDEFRKFLHRTFHGNLRLAWDFFDDDDSGEIDIVEWENAVRKVGYFGPVKQTFYYIDLDDQGTVCFDEFEAMWDTLDSRASRGSVIAASSNLV